MNGDSTMSVRPRSNIDTVSEPVTTRSVLTRGCTRLASSNFAMGLLALLLMVALWEVIVLVFRMPSYILPAPTLVGQQILEQHALLLSATGTTLSEVLVGFGIAVGVGIPFAVAIAFSRILRRLFYPLLITSQSMPVIAIAPVLLAWFGFGFPPKIIIAAVIAVFPIVINTVAGLQVIDEDMLRMARSTGASPRRLLWKIRVPTALPSTLAGMKLGITLSVVGAVVGEFVAGTSGLGYVIQNAQGNLQMPLAFAAIVVLAWLGVLLFYSVEVAERKLIPWHSSQRLVGRG